MRVIAFALFSIVGAIGFTSLCFGADPARDSGVAAITPIPIKSTEFIYTRKKSGQSSLLVTSAVPCLVKLIDLQVGRLAAMVAMPAGRAVEFPLPESKYGIVYAEGPGKRSDGSFDATWFGKVSEIDLTTPGTRRRVVLSIGDDKAGITPSDLATWNRFNPPGSAAVSLD
jgi:hypothetical protein